MTKPLDDQSLQELIKAVTEEVVQYLAADGCAREISDASAAASKMRAIVAGADRSSASPESSETRIAALIDHTLLKPGATRSEIEELCREAVRFGFASVCVNPWYVPLAAEMVHGSTVKVCTVVGFPFGATLTSVKMYETEQAIKLGAHEIDMVQNVGALKSGDYVQLEADIRGVADVCHRDGAICKVILEMALLSQDEKVRASTLAQCAGADFIKTCTGFASGGATAEDVALMRAAVGPSLGIKAAGGIRSLADLQRMVAAGATRIGASASVKIVEQAREAAGKSALRLGTEDAKPKT
jgi:deoxyribose-phosphate aldolase